MIEGWLRDPLRIGGVRFERELARAAERARAHEKRARPLVALLVAGEADGAAAARELSAQGAEVRDLGALDAGVPDRVASERLLGAVDADLLVVKAATGAALAACHVGLAFLFHDKVVLDLRGAAAGAEGDVARSASLVVRDGPLPDLAPLLAARGFGGLGSEPGTGEPRPLVFVPLFDRVGGMERQAAAQLRALAHRGLSPVLLTNGFAGRATRERREDAVVVRLAPPSPSALWPFRQARTLRAFVRRFGHRFSVLHAHAWSEVSGPLVEAARELGIPSIVKVASEGDVDLLARSLRPDMARAARQLVRGAARALAVSTPIRDELIAAGVAPERIALIPNGVDAERFRPPSAEERARARRELGLDEGAFVAAYVGRPSRAKGVDTALDAFARAGLKDARFLIAGDGDERGELERRAPPGAVFLGARDDVPALLAAADAFVFLSLPRRRDTRGEGLPNALLEAMACGLPAIGSDIDVTRDLIDATCGVRVPASDSAAAAAALARLAAEPRTREALGAAARRRIEERFSLGSVVSALVALYRTVASEVRTPA